MLIQLGSLVLVLLLLILSISIWKLHPFVALLLASILLGVFLGFGGAKTLEAVVVGFSNTLKWIALVVIMGAFIGEVLRETGGAQRISHAITRQVGEKGLPAAMGVTGYVISIPVFVDVAYIVLQPITEALAGKTGKPILVLGLSLAAGLTVSHTLIPPTPGPLALASYLGADLGRMIWVNGIVGLFAVAGGVLWASTYCKRFRIPYDRMLATREGTLSESSSKEGRAALWGDLLPIGVPILLMGMGAFLSFEGGSTLDALVSFVSIPVVAVMIGAGIAWLLYAQRKAASSVSELVDAAIVKSALVLMITGAGGAFGYLIRESGIQNSLSEFFLTLPYLGFILPFLLAAVLTSATGSITVSLIGTGSILGPMVGSLGFSPELLAALIGSGAFCVFHANSSFFWLLNRLHEVPVPILYRTYTLQSLVMGLSGLVGVLVLMSLGLR
ncbi:MAG: GntP family permease [Bacteroidota bacterium]